MSKHAEPETNLNKKTSGEMLDMLDLIGKPQLLKLSDGCWVASLEYGGDEGVSASVSSSNDHVTHDDALRDLIFRLIALSKKQTPAVPQFEAG